MVSGQQRVKVATLLVSGQKDQCDVTVTLVAYWLVRSEGGNEGRTGRKNGERGKDRKEKGRKTGRNVGTKRKSKKGNYNT